MCRGSQDGTRICAGARIDVAHFNARCSMKGHLIRDNPVADVCAGSPEQQRRGSNFVNASGCSGAFLEELARHKVEAFVALSRYGGFARLNSGAAVLSPGRRLCGPPDVTSSSPDGPLYRRPVCGSMSRTPSFTEILEENAAVFALRLSAVPGFTVTVREEVISSRNAERDGARFARSNQPHRGKPGVNMRATPPSTGRFQKNSSS